MSLSSFIWSVADLLRGDYKQSEYGKVILPFTVLRRMDCVLEATKEAVLAEHAARHQAGINPEPFLLRKAQNSFYNISPMDMKTLMGDQDHIKENLYSYIQAFSPSVRDIFERFEFYAQIDRLPCRPNQHSYRTPLAGVALAPVAPGGLVGSHDYRGQVEDTGRRGASGLLECAGDADSGELAFAVSRGPAQPRGVPTGGLRAQRKEGHVRRYCDPVQDLCGVLRPHGGPSRKRLASNAAGTRIRSH